MDMTLEGANEPTSLNGTGDVVAGGDAALHGIDEQLRQLKSIEEALARSAGILNGLASQPDDGEGRDGMQAAFGAVIAELRNRVAGLELRWAEEMGATAGESTAEAADLTAQPTAADQRTTGASTELAERLEYLETAVAEASQSGAEFVATFGSRINRIGALERDVALHGERMNMLEQGIATHQRGIDAAIARSVDDIAAVREQLTGHRQRLEQCETAVTEACQRGDQTVAELAPLRLRVTKMEEEFSTLANRLNAAYGQRDAVSSLSGVVAHNAKQTQRLERDIADARRSIGELTAALASRAARVGTLERDLTLHAERLNVVELDANVRRQQLFRFPPSVDLLPLMTPKENARRWPSGIWVSAEAEAGHFLYGPYLTVQPGSYELEMLLRADNLRDPECPVLTVEIAAGDHVVAGRVLRSPDIEKSFEIYFEVPETIRGADAKLEFRFSHHQNAEIEVAEARLHIAKPRPARPGGFFSRLFRFGA